MSAAFDPGALIKQRILRSTKDLPPLPSAVMRVLQETDRPECSALSLEKIVLTDQALTAQLFACRQLGLLRHERTDQQREPGDHDPRDPAGAEPNAKRGGDLDVYSEQRAAS